MQHQTFDTYIKHILREHTYLLLMAIYSSVVSDYHVKKKYNALKIIKHSSLFLVVLDFYVKLDVLNMLRYNISLIINVDFIKLIEKYE